MPAITLAGHMSTGHDGFAARPSVEGCAKVSVGGVPVHCEGHAWAAHSNGGGSHVGYLAQGAPYVTIGGRGVGRVGDPITCGDTVAQGCSRVTVGNCGGAEYAREKIFTNLNNPMDKLVLCLPEMEALQSERMREPHDRQGWIYAHECSVKWMSRKAYITKGEFDIGGQDPYLVDWNWAMQYQRFRETINNMVSYSSLTKDDAKSNLTRFLQEDGYFTGQGHSFDYITLPLDKLRSRAFQSEPSNWKEVMGWLPPFVIADDTNGKPVPDGFHTAIGASTFFAVAKGNTARSASGWQVTVRQVGAFIYDGFDFDGDQWLGSWRCEPLYKGFDLYQGTVLHNKNFRDFRQHTGYGCDFRTMCLPELVNIREFTYDAIL